MAGGVYWTSEYGRAECRFITGLAAETERVCVVETICCEYSGGVHILGVDGQTKAARSVFFWVNGSEVLSFI